MKPETFEIDAELWDVIVENLREARNHLNSGITYTASKKVQHAMHAVKNVEAMRKERVEKKGARRGGDQWLDKPSDLSASLVYELEQPKK